MSDTGTDVKETAASLGNAVEEKTEDMGETLKEAGGQFNERYQEVLAKVNDSLDRVDWSQVGRIGKGFGILLAVIIAQILIKAVLDTIDLLPVIPGLLELLGLVVVGKWSWENLTTSEKRAALNGRIQTLRREYLG
jgi:ElaB/YqjD/DUF883 family membrane-anchored ribosome-binding protein